MRSGCSRRNTRRAACDSGSKPGPQMTSAAPSSASASSRRDPGPARRTTGARALICAFPRDRARERTGPRDPSQPREDGVRCPFRIENPEAPRLLAGAAAIGGPHAAVERDLLAFELVDLFAAGAAPLGDAPERDLDGAVEEVRAIGDARAPPAVELVDGRVAEAPAGALIGARGVRVPVAEDGGARVKGGLDRLE